VKKKQKPPHPTQRKSVNGIFCQKIAVRRNTAQSGAAGRSEFLRSRKFLKKRCYCRRVQKRQQIPLTKVAILCSRSAILCNPFWAGRRLRPFCEKTRASVLSMQRQSALSFCDPNCFRRFKICVHPCSSVVKNFGAWCLAFCASSLAKTPSTNSSKIFFARIRKNRARFRRFAGRISQTEFRSQNPC